MKQTKKILVPTDFSVKSLQIVKETLEQMPDMNFEIILACGVMLPGSITDLLFVSKRKMIDEVQPQEFIEACKIIKARYHSRITNMYVDVLTSNNSSYVRNYLQGVKVDALIVPENYSFKYRHSNCFNVFSALKKQAPSIFELRLPGEAMATSRETNSLSDLFLNPLELSA